MIEPTQRENLLRLARAYASHTGLSLASVARAVHGDHPFFEELQKLHKRRGARKDRRGSFTARKFDEMMQAFSDLFESKDIPWPPLKPLSNDRPPPKKLRRKRKRVVPSPLPD